MALFVIALAMGTIAWIIIVAVIQERRSDSFKRVNTTPRWPVRVEMLPGLGGDDFVVTHPNGQTVTCGSIEEAAREAGPHADRATLS